MAEREGIIYSVNGPVIEARQVTGIYMGDMVEVGEERLIAETIALEGDRATIQVFEDTSGLRPGVKVYGTGLPLAVELGPGLLGNTFDGIQRPLELIRDRVGNFIQRGVKVPALDREKKWRFQPRVQVGDQVSPNNILGVVQETELIELRILVPPDVEVQITYIIEEGDYTVYASKTGFQDSDMITITIEGGIPGFELLTLLVALGVAFILLRRRRH